MLVSRLMNFLFGTPTDDKILEPQENEETINTKLENKVNSVWDNLSSLFEKKKETYTPEDSKTALHNKVFAKIQDLKKRGIASVEKIRNEVSQIIGDYPKLKLSLVEGSNNISVEIHDLDLQTRLHLILAHGAE